MSRIEAVIFDIGNVLIEWRPERYCDSATGKERRRKMFADVALHGMNDRVDRGENFRDVICSTAGEYPAWGDEIRLWHDDWNKLAGPVIGPTIQRRRRRGRGCLRLRL